MPPDPDRLFITRCRICLTREAEREEDTGIPARTQEVAYTLDLETVVGVREAVEFDADREWVIDGECVVELSTGDACTLVDDYRAVQAAWVAYRRHADRIARLRN